MIRTLFVRLIALLLTLAAASVVIFAVIEVIPGDPAAFMLGLNADPQTVAALRAELGLNSAPAARYAAWVGGMLSGDFGLSYTYRVPVADLLAQRLAVSVPLTLYALALSVAVALPAGLIAATRQGRVADAVLTGAVQAGLAVPNFWFGMLLVLAFAVALPWFPAGGFPGWDAGVLAGLHALTLPAIALALPQAAILARVLRAALIEAMAQDYVRFARAKGLTRAQAVRRHALRNAAIPVLTILGLQLSFLLAGGVIIENVFALPGLGRLILQAVTQRDLVVVESVTMLLVAAAIVVTFAVDLAVVAADPRLRRPA